MFVFHTIGRLDELVENHRDVLEDIVDLSAVDYTRRHTTPSPEVDMILQMRKVQVEMKMAIIFRMWRVVSEIAKGCANTS